MPRMKAKTRRPGRRRKTHFLKVGDEWLSAEEIQRRLASALSAATEKAAAQADVPTAEAARNAHLESLARRTKALFDDIIRLARDAASHGIDLVIERRTMTNPLSNIDGTTTQMNGYIISLQQQIFPPPRTKPIG